ncbi:vWA domain-containing protein [Pararhizobium sp.]|uniref:vWA domain-containing protein n=1 Tax=Pararhizobium sp. TaxID=1977563 RepID=UPI0027192108|nr:VWA domain-containing protein [Pararhizobium sp.]MDO9415792.1 VWA domain-containing protein [Pararhizobium sp.]
MRFLTAMAFAASLLFALPAVSADRTMIVFDASGSMWGQIDGKTKIEIARETISKVIPSVSKDTELGLMAYGHRDKGSCSDIELVIPPATGTQSAIIDFVENVEPKGKTPLTQAVREAAEAMKYTEEKTTVVLVTDGLESCEADPCALAEELESKGVDFTAHVVGFGLTEEEGSKVSCLAEKTGGKYFQASDADQLVAALAATVAKPPVIKEEPVEAEPEPVKLEYNTMFDSTISEGGPSLGHDNTDVHWTIYKATADNQRDGDYIDSQYYGAFNGTYPAGRYIAVANLNSAIEREVRFEVKDGEVAKPYINFDAAVVTITPKRTPEDAEPDGNAAVRVSFGGYSTTNYGRAKMYASAGEVKLEGTIGSTTVQDSFPVKAGETVEHDIIIGTGVVMNKAVYLAGGLEVESSEIFFQIESATKDINGQRKTFGNTYGTGTKIDSPAGDFILTAKLGSATGQTPYTIKAGEAKDVVIDINAGVLAVTAPGAYRIDIQSAKKDIQGNQKDYSPSFGAEHKDTLPAGDYIVHVTYEGDKAPQDKPVKITAGERTEITVE